MLTKLIKYNLQFIFKKILPFIILVFIAVIGFNLTDYTITYVQNDQHNIIGEIFSVPDFVVFLHGLFNFLINISLLLLFASAIRSIWSRFNSNFYSDEAYLTHTLPISRKTLWNAHFLSMLIIFLSLILVIVTNCFILTLTRGGLKMLDSLGLIGGCAHCLGIYYYIEPLNFNFYFSYALLVFVELTFLTLCGITGMVIKHRFHKNLALISGVAIYLIGNLLLIGCFYFIGNFDHDILDILSGVPIRTSGFDFDTSYIYRTFYYLSTIYLCYCATLYFIDQKLLQQGINLD